LNSLVAIDFSRITLHHGVEKFEKYELKLGRFAFRVYTFVPGLRKLRKEIGTLKPRPMPAPTVTTERTDNLPFSCVRIFRNSMHW